MDEVLIGLGNVDKHSGQKFEWVKQWLVMAYDEGVLPVEHSGQRRHREPRRVVGTARRLLTLDEKGELLTEKEILGGEGTLRTDEIPSEREGVEDNGHNIREQTQERTFPRSE